ncbi:unnamed protein product [Dicrocoelium dendriticum]|nr:unnamed protein product [Dicrocoelium dendriticum]
MCSTELLQELQVVRPDVHSRFLIADIIYSSQQSPSNEEESGTNSCNSSSVSVTTSETVMASFSSSEGYRRGEGQLFRSKNAREGFKSHMGELDRFCLLHLEQALQGCPSAEARAIVTEKIEKHKLLQATTETLVTQLPEIARMQAEVEKCRWTVILPALADQLEISIKPRTTLTAPTLQQFSTQQLKLIMDDLHSVIDDLNQTLVKELTDRDELYLAQGAKCTEIEDLSAYFKELCIRTSIQRVRRKALSTLSAYQSKTRASDQQLPSDMVSPDSCNSVLHSDKHQFLRQNSFPVYSKPRKFPLLFRRGGAAPQVS